MSNRIYAATRKGLFTIDRGTSGWKISRAEFLGLHVDMVMSDPRDGSVYVSVYHEHFGPKLHRSTDRGATFTEIGTPAYPEQPAGEVDLCPFRKTPIPWKLKKIWALSAGNADQKGTIWAGTIPGGLFRSNDFGASWEIVRPLWDHPKRKMWVGGGADFPGIHSVCVDPRDSRVVTIGVSSGGPWRTTDGGETWDAGGRGMRQEYVPPEMEYEPNAQDPHIIVQCPSKPDYYWCQHHNGVFRSVDNLKSWAEIKTVQPAVFGFAVAVHPKDPETAWFVPAKKDEFRIPVDGKVVVARTRDGGKSFEVLRKGLPQEHAYDLTFRHGLDIDETGSRLAFGSTTGSLWVTEDQGDSWQTVAEHLPPVYCVRFVK